MSSRYTFEHQGGRGGRKRLVYATLLVLVVFLLDMLSGGSVRALAQSATARVWTATARVRSAVLDSGYFSTHRSLARENASLREQLATQTEKAAAHEALKQENELLRSMLNLTQSDPGITAPVVSSVRSSPYGTFVVGAGEGDGISPGSLVVTEGGFVVGRVTEVRERTTLVTEIFAGGASIDVMVANAAAAAEGRGGGNARVLVPRGIEVKPGDAVTAPLFGGRPIGLVGRVESSSASAEQTVYVNLPVNLGALRYVYIIPMH